MAAGGWAVVSFGGGNLGYRCSFCTSCGGPLHDSEPACARCVPARKRARRAGDLASPPTRTTHDAGPTQSGDTALDLRASLPEPTLSAHAPPSASLETQLSAGALLALDPEEVPESAAPILAGFLVSYSERLGRYWPLLQGRNRVGRRPVQRGGGPDVPLDDPTVSIDHALIFASANPARMKLEDLGSRNGTYLDGLRVPPGRKVELSDGQLLALGEFRAIVKIV